MAKKTPQSQKVTFTAKKVVKEPTVVSFNTKQGRVSFTARVNVEKPVQVSFKAKNKK
ncbi:MAG: hypothetical protein H6791_01560 [Candidatus Nomurabacteria bacterium]|nr:MAG: hypothetical protein H6791_01560 [Candidatus Nomurabacteria bacterium]